MILKWINHACIQIKTENGKIIYFDPYELDGSYEKADLVLCSHDHHDHLSVSDIQKIASSNTTVIIPKVCSLRGNFKIVQLDIGEIVKVDDINIEGVPAYTEKLQTHPKDRRWLGYILETEGKRIYHAGDTGKMPEMTNFKDINVACLPVGGKFTMGFEEAAQSAELIKPEIVVPMHNWGKDMAPYKEMTEKMLPGIRVEILIGRELTI